MRILQIATLITPDGAYGGPIRVAVNQVRALREAGHDAILIAGASGFDGELPTEFDGVPVKLFPVTRLIPGIGFAGLASPAMLAWLRANVDGFDAFHVHLARDFVTLRAGRLLQRRGKRYVLQTHGMIDASDKLLAKPLDAVYTVPLLRGADRVFYLTPREREDLLSVGGPDVRIEHVVNGVPLVDPELIVAADEGALDVLYLARLQTRKRPEFFAAAALELAPRHPDASFTLVGPDEGAAPAVAMLITAAPAAIRQRVRWDGPLDPVLTLERIARCDIYVLPSVDEPFPMSVLEALSCGKPVIITDTCGLAPYVAEARAGIVVDDSQEALNAAIESLLADPELRAEYARNAAELAHTRFGMQQVSDALIAAYGDR